MAVKYVPENVEFLTEWVGFELPKGILNKGITGCGATSVAIEDEHKTIICSPRINLIDNKAGQHKGLFGVYGDVKNDEIKAYLEKTATPKIMATYDALPRLARLIDDKTDWRVVVDEYQYLLIDSGFKSDTALALLDVLNEFDYVTYLSATPIADRYIQQMEQFKDVPYTKLIWSNVEKIDVERVVSAKPINNAIEIVRNYQSGRFPHIDGVQSTECVIFLNSVTNIVNIIRQCDLQSDEVNIIIAKTSENKEFVKELGNRFEIGECPKRGEQHKMFTFCTSTAFAGCDFYSTCASTFVISDNKRVHTSIDIATELVQIAGRQRLACNPFRKSIVFIYNVDIGEGSADAYKEAIERKLMKSEKMAEYKNGAIDKDIKNDLIRETSEMQNIKKYSESYVRYDEKSDSFAVNHMAYMNDLFAYDVQHENYQNSIIVKKQLEDSGFSVGASEKMADYKEQLKCILTKEGFADRMKRYCELRRLKESSPFVFATELMEQRYDGLKLYYDKLGYEKIRALGYKESGIKREMELYYRANDIKRKFREIFTIGKRMTVDEIRQRMREVYASYGIKKSGVATDLEKEYGISIKYVKIATLDGIRKGGYEFI